VSYTELFYVQDTRPGATVGNSALWWRWEGKGYTCDLNEAGVFTQEDIASMGKTDKPWPVKAIRKLARPHVDVQDLPRPPKDLPHNALEPREKKPCS
jgi:hypothetical protein